MNALVRLSALIVTVTTEPDSRLPGAGMALIANVADVTMPGAVRLEKTQVVGMNPRIGAANSVGVAMTSGAGTGRRVGLVARSATFDIIAGRVAMIGKPTQGGMQKWNPVFAFMASDAEGFPVMTAGAIRLFAVGIKTMGEGIVEVVDIAKRIVATMAVYTILFLLMATPAPVAIQGGLLAMIVAPPGRVNVV